MKMLICLLILQLVGRTYIPPTIPPDCMPDINLRAVICPNNRDSLSFKYCPCSGCCAPKGIRAIDKNYSIISFKIKGIKLCSEVSDRMEVENTGAAWNEAQFIINKACRGSLIIFSCIKAKDKNGRIYTLLPFAHQLE